MSYVQHTEDWVLNSQVVKQKGSQGYSRISNADESTHRLRFFAEGGEGSRVLVPDEELLNWALDDFKADTRKRIVHVTHEDDRHTYYLSTQ